MKELGTIIAFAFHEPNKLDTLFKPQIEDLIDTSKKDPEAWDYDEWWKTTE
jgi:hypothetical protein